MLFFLTCIMEILEKKRVDEMVCGMFKNKSYFGKRSSVLKSGVCKYYRTSVLQLLPATNAQRIELHRCYGCTLGLARRVDIPARPD